MKNALFCGVLAAMAALATNARCEITVHTAHNESGDASADFKFKGVPRPAKNGTAGKFTIVAGEVDDAGGGLEKLNDGHLPGEEDDPAENFFFNAGTPGGRLKLDLNQSKPIRQINTYSWHANTRAPQVYKVYGATGSAPDFNPAPAHDQDPAACGWTLIASVDTRPKDGDPGGQYGVSISDSASNVGEYRYLLFDCKAAETDDGFGNTFYSEINVLGPGDAGADAGPSASVPEIKPYDVHTPDGKYEIVFDASRAPDLADWTTNKLAPVLLEWYPKIVDYLPSEGFEAPAKFTVTLRPGRGVADTENTRINVYIPWVHSQINGQAIGSVVHECVHVVQQYGYARRHNPHPAENPGYFVEGLADYFRFYKFEPQTKGAEIRRRGLQNANYNRSYRVTANFLNWATEKFGQDLVPRLNAAMREGNYSADFWTKETSKSLQDLNTAWKDDLKKKLGGESSGG
ncbi:MAG TPA: basic secretory protein-like protein [Verrucomicrobiae bacterium]|jgi:hypothetical protein